MTQAYQEVSAEVVCGKRQLNTCDLMKAAALVLMIVDHVGFYFLRDYAILRAIGRSSAPIWLFFVGYFYHHKDDVKMYVLTAVDYPLQQFYLACYHHSAGLNILATVIISRLIVQKIMLYQHNAFILSASIFLLVLFRHSSGAWIDYGTVMTLFALAGALKKENNPYSVPVLLISLIVYISLEQDIFQFETPLLSLVIGMMSGVCCLLNIFRLERFQRGAIGFQDLILWLSRHSLFIYLAHLNVFRALSLVIDYGLF